MKTLITKEEVAKSACMWKMNMAEPRRLEKNLHGTVCWQMQTNQLLESLYGTWLTKEILQFSYIKCDTNWAVVKTCLLTVCSYSLVTPGTG